MKTVATIVGFMLFCVARAEDNKTQPSSDQPFDRAVKILRFGPVNDYVQPTKGDAVVFLGLLGDERALPVLTEHLAHEFDANLRYQITKALAWIKSRKAVPALEKSLKDEDVHVRNGAAMALTKITGKQYQIEQTPIPAKVLQILSKELATRPQTVHPSGTSNPALKLGETYHFVFMQPPRPPLVGKVVESPKDNWVKIQIGSDQSNTSWINMVTLAYISHTAEDK